VGGGLEYQASDFSFLTKQDTHHAHKEKKISLNIPMFRVTDVKLSKGSFDQPSCKRSALSYVL
jgi:hypothetical protein